MHTFRLVVPSFIINIHHQQEQKYRSALTNQSKTVLGVYVTQYDKHDIKLLIGRNFFLSGKIISSSFSHDKQLVY